MGFFLCSLPLMFSAKKMTFNHRFNRIKDFFLLPGRLGYFSMEMVVLIDQLDILTID